MALANVLQQCDVTLVVGTPTLLLPALRARPALLAPGSSLRCVAFGGEPCPTTAQLAPLWRPESPVRLFNIYGITGARAQRS